MTVDEKKTEIRRSTRDTQIATLAHQDIQLEDHIAAVEKALKTLRLGAFEVQQRIADLEKMEVISQADVNAVMAQISKLRNILLPGSDNTNWLAVTGGTVGMGMTTPGSSLYIAGQKY